MCLSLMCTLPTKRMSGTEKKKEMLVCVEVASERDFFLLGDNHGAGVGVVCLDGVMVLFLF